MMISHATPAEGVGRIGRTYGEREEVGTVECLEQSDDKRYAGFTFNEGLVEGGESEVRCSIKRSITETVA